MNDVKVVIELSKASPRAGFGFPLVITGYCETYPFSYIETSSLDELKNICGENIDGNAAALFKAVELLFMQDNAPSKIAVAAPAESALEYLPSVIDKGWRQLIVVGASDEETVEISNYIESCGANKLFFTKALYFETGSVGSGEIASDFEVNNKRTVAVAVSSMDANCLEAAVVGATAGLDVGSFTYKNIVLKGVDAQFAIAPAIENVHSNNAITVTKKAGEIVTSEGITCSGEYIDIVDCQDYIIEQIEYQCQSLMNRVPKLHYDERGISALESVVVSVLKDAANQGMIAQNEDGDYMYSVNFLPRSECSDTDISSRHYTGGSFEFTLAGAIHTAKITGQIIA